MTYANLTRMAFGYATSQILYAAVRLGVPDALADGAMPLGQLADTLECDPGGLTRLVRALVVLGVIEQVAPEQVALTVQGRPLCANHPRSMRSSLLLLGAPAVWQAWGALTHGARTGKAAFDHAHGRPLFAYLAGDPDLSEVFNAAMGEGTEWVAHEVPKAFDFTGGGTVIDIGGGNGTLLSAVLAAAPDARGVLFDTAEGAADAVASFQRAGLADRVSVEHGDFFEAVPEGDVMLLKGILHDWDDQRCGIVLRNCRASIATDGRLLVLEPVLPVRLDTAEANGVVMSDIAMLVYTGGRERSRAEFQSLLAASGFHLADVQPPLAGSMIRIIIAHPA